MFYKIVEGTDLNSIAKETLYDEIESNDISNEYDLKNKIKKENERKANSQITK